MAAPGADPPGTGAPGAPPAAPARFRQRDGEVEWVCTTCGLYNPLAASTCTACGTAMTAAFAPTGETGRAADPRAVLAASVVLPGSGHVLAGQAATGVARALLYIVWLGGGLALMAAGGAPLVTVPLLLGAAAIWGGTVVDVAGLGTERAQVLQSRALLWLVVGVTLLSLLGLAAGVAGLA